MIEFFQKIIELLQLSYETLNKATDALNGVNFDKTLVFSYLGYMHYGMGDTLYIMFSTCAVIGIGASLWSFVVKGVDWLKDMIPGA